MNTSDEYRGSREQFLTDYWNNTEAVDRLIAGAAGDPEQKRLLDELVAAYTRRMASHIVWKYRGAVHAGTEAGDIADEMFLAYLRADPEKMIRSGQPKAYLCRIMLNAENRLWGQERTLLSCHNKVTSSLRADVRHALAHEEELIDWEHDSPAAREVLARICTNNTFPVPVDGTPGSTDQVEIPIADHRSEEAFASVLQDRSMEGLLLTFFPEPMTRILFWFLYLRTKEDPEPMRMRMDKAYAALSRKFGIDREDFLQCRNDLLHYMDRNRNAMREFILGESAPA